MVGHALGARFIGCSIGAAQCVCQLFARRRGFNVRRAERGFERGGRAIVPRPRVGVIVNTLVTDPVGEWHPTAIAQFLCGCLTLRREGFVWRMIAAGHLTHRIPARMRGRPIAFPGITGGDVFYVDGDASLSADEGLIGGVWVDVARHVRSPGSRLHRVHGVHEIGSHEPSVRGPTTGMRTTNMRTHTNM